MSGNSQLPKILLKHTRIEINNYDPGDASMLEYLFTINDKITHSIVPKGIEYDDKNRRLILPRGMDLELLIQSFMVEPIVDRECDPFVNMEPIPIKYLTKDERQLEILKFILGVEKHAYTKTKSQIAVNSTTGSGKTFLSVAAICFTGCRTMIITSSIDWLKQWRERILEYTNLTDNDIFMIAGSPSISKIINRDPLQYKIFLVSHSTIRSYGDSSGWDKVAELFKHLKCSFKIYDECHLYFDNMCTIDFHTNTKKTLYLTATPGRSDRDENLIYKQYFFNIPSIELFDEENDPHVNYIGLLYNSNPTAFEVSSFTKGPYKFDRNVYVNYLVDKPNFLKLVSVIIDMTLRLPGKVLIYIQTNDAIIKVYNYIMQEFPFLNGAVGIFTTLTPKAQKADMQKLKFILSTTKSCGAAIDIADLGVTVVLAEPFKSEITARQTLGRCRNPNTYYIDCIDNSVYRTRIYYKSKKYIFSKYAKSCSQVYMDDVELEEKSEAIRDKYTTKKLMTLPVFKR